MEMGPKGLQGRPSKDIISVMYVLYWAGQTGLGIMAVASAMKLASGGHTPYRNKAFSRPHSQEDVRGSLRTDPVTMDVIKVCVAAACCPIQKCSSPGATLFHAPTVS